ncbi:unnamed protein product, partial [marine sediment metagenome]
IFREISQHIDLTEIHEIRDLQNGKVIAVLSKKGGQIIRDEVDILQIEGAPFVSAYFNGDPDLFWGPSDCRILEPIQLELNEANTQAMYHRRITLLKFFYNLNLVDPDQVDAMLAGEVGPGIGVDGDPASAVSIMQPHIPPDLLEWFNSKRADAREILGMGRQELGEVSQGRTTKGEAEIAHFGSALRMDEKRDSIADALGEIMRKVNQVIFKFWSVEQVIPVVGYDGARYWVKYNNEMLRGEYNLQIDVESMTPLTKR